MKLSLVFGLVLMLSSQAFAAPETSQLGPYLVSFDLNTNMQHQLQVIAPIQTQSAMIYGIQIFTDNTTEAVLSICRYMNPTDSTLGPYKQLSAMDAALRLFDVTSVIDRTIDGNDGFLLTSVPTPEATRVPADIKLFRAIYWMDSTKCECGPLSVGKTRVDITSSYPQEVTEALLNSLHVEDSQASTTYQSVSPKLDNSQSPANKDVFSSVNFTKEAEFDYKPIEPVNRKDSGQIQTTNDVF